MPLRASFVNLVFPTSWVFSLVLFAFANGCLLNEDEQTDFENFVERVETAKGEGWVPYWLGESFKVSGLTFYGPGVADFGAEVVGGGVDYSYDAHGQEPFAELRIVIYSPGAWERARDRQDFGGQATAVLGRKARCTSIPAASRPVGEVRCIIEFPDTIVTAIAPSLNADPPGSPNQNPLLDVDLLLSVLENLRPYPE